MKKVSNKIKICLSVFLGVIFIIVVYFTIPYSKTKLEFNNDVDTVIAKTHLLNEVFTNEDIKDLPSPVQKYFKYCGYIGSPKMAYMKAEFKNVNFLSGINKPSLKIDYTQYNFVDEPIRLAFINSSMFGIPFQGYDSYMDGIAFMKGVIAKTFTLFDYKGEHMDKASLVTYLAEALIIPSVAIENYVTWEEIDDNHAKATITYYGISASGIFTFNYDGEMVSFTTEDRTFVDDDGTTKQVKWSAVCSDYKEINGIKQPTIFKAVWHFDNGDLVYFNGKDIKIEFGK